ncbi:MAG: YeeE/YedE family protein [Rhizobiales bacterium]|nr:YeeE/YedE family protein [Hyphomicrobiales bacterium]
MGRFAIFVSGLLFGSGLAISGMVNPMKVLNFLDPAGAWDPTLIFVMAGGLIVTLLGYRLAFARSRPFAADVFSLPQSRTIDAKLIGGSALFGLGWGLSGLCPGPAIAGLVFGRIESVAFVAAMAAGYVATRMIAASTPRVAAEG